MSDTDNAQYPTKIRSIPSIMLRSRKPHFKWGSATFTRPRVIT